MPLYGPNVLVAFMGAVGILILTIVLQIKPEHRLIEGGKRRSSFHQRLQRKLTQADLDISAGEFLRISLFLGLALGLVLYLSIGAWTAFLVGLGIGMAGYWSYLEDRRDNRRRQYQDEMSAAIDMLLQASSVGMGVPLAIEFAAERAPGMVRVDFEKVRRLQTTGTPLDEALKTVALERQDMLFDRLTEALISTHLRQTSLVDVLRPMNELVRGLSAARRRIATAQVRIRWEARIVCVAPFVFILILNQTAPDLQHPFYGSVVGQIALIVIGVLCFSAYYLMNRIGARAMRPVESVNESAPTEKTDPGALGALA